MITVEIHKTNILFLFIFVLLCECVYDDCLDTDAMARVGKALEAREQNNSMKSVSPSISVWLLGSNCGCQT